MTVSVHRLLQKTIRDDSDVRNDLTNAVRALSAVDDVFPDEVKLPTHWPLCEQLLPHALALADVPTWSSRAAERLINLLNRACDYLNRAEPGQRGLTTAQRTLAHAERLLAPDHAGTLTTRHHLAIAHGWAGNKDQATAIHEPLLVDLQRILGAEHPHTLAARNGLAGAYRVAGRTNEAIAIYEPLLTDRERIFGANPDLAARWAPRPGSGRRGVRLSRDSLGCEVLKPRLGRITLRVQRDGRNVTVEVTADGEGLVSHAGSALLAQIADKSGLTQALSVRLAGLKARRSGHDRGRVVRDLAVMLADGGDWSVPGWTEIGFVGFLS